MLHFLKGTIFAALVDSVVIDVGGVGFLVRVTEETIRGFPERGNTVFLFTHLHVREDAFELYGFSTEKELRFFELLISVSGVGPKSALSIMDIAELEKLSAAIQEGRPDLMTRASGVGRKTAERIIVELRGKVAALQSQDIVARMEGDSDLVDALVGLGYKRVDAQKAISQIDKKIEGLDARLKEALRIMGGK